MTYLATTNDQAFHINLDNPERITVDEEPHSASIEGIGGPSLYSLIVDNSSYEVHVEEHNGGYRVLLLGQLYEVHIEDEGARLFARARQARRPLEDEEVVVRSPIPGLIFDVPVVAGQEVKQGDILVIVEAMKMENELRAPRDAVVESTHVAPGDSVDKGSPLVTLS
jgi:biotin carboxyl carrier protein